MKKNWGTIILSIKRLGETVFRLDQNNILQKFEMTNCASKYFFGPFTKCGRWFCVVESAVVPGHGPNKLASVKLGKLTCQCKHWDALGFNDKENPD